VSKLLSHHHHVMSFSSLSVPSVSGASRAAVAGDDDDVYVLCAQPFVVTTKNYRSPLVIKM
jgi:hypothetical protein